jgi:hypothetical protein
MIIPKIISRLFQESMRSFPLFWLANIFIIGSLLSYLLLANLHVNPRQEEVIKKEWIELVSSFPKRDNASAIQLDMLLAKLGFRVNADPSSELSPELESIRLENSGSWEDVRGVLNNYIESQNQESDDNLNSMPSELKKYLSQHNSQIEAVVEHLKSNELPEWGITYLDENKMPDYTTAFPSFLNLVNLQRLLIASAVEQSQNRQYTESMETLSASLKFSFAVAQRPDLIAQLVAIIGINIHSETMRKFDHLKLDWAEGIQIPSLHQGLAKSLEMEAFSTAETFRKYSISDIKFSFFEVSDEDAKLDAPFGVLQYLFQQPFLRLAAGNYFWKMMEHVEKISSLPAQRFCSLKNDPDLENLELDPISWNPLIRNSQPYLTQFSKVNKSLLRWELTKKIVKIKEQVIQTGDFPSQNSDLETSQVCPDLSWDYRVTNDGEMSIGLSQLPEWLEIRENESPLSYSLRVEDIE